MIEKIVEAKQVKQKTKDKKKPTKPDRDMLSISNYTLKIECPASEAEYTEY